MRYSCKRKCVFFNSKLRVLSIPMRLGWCTIFTSRRWKNGKYSPCQSCNMELLRKGTRRGWGVATLGLGRKRRRGRPSILRRWRRWTGVVARAPPTTNRYWLLWRCSPSSLVSRWGNCGCRLTPGSPARWPARVAATWISHIR